jgi:hypothetical protein
MNLHVPPVPGEARLWKLDPHGQFTVQQVRFDVGCRTKQPLKIFDSDRTPARRAQNAYGSSKGGQRDGDVRWIGQCNSHSYKDRVPSIEAPIAAHPLPGVRLLQE